MDNTNSGVLFKNSDQWTIIQQGKLNIDGDEQRIIGVRRKNKDGQYIVELFRAIGTLKANDEKQSEKSPDAKGVINKITDTGAMTISAWKEKSEAGNEYTQLKCRDFSNESDQVHTPPNLPESKPTIVSNDLDEEIPF